MSYYNGQQEIPRALLNRELLLPILDGLDEIEESPRRSAVAGINSYIGQDRAVVVTCRSAEYEDVIKGGSLQLHRAPVVRITPVPAHDVIEYLKAVDRWPAGTVWDAVFADLKNRQDSPLAAALSTPLMVSLARMIYQRCGGDPAKLLDSDTFKNRHAVEDYLFDRVIDAAYTPDGLPSGEPVNLPARNWEAAQAKRWLTFLAHYLHQYRERDLAWWRLSQRLVSPLTVPWIGILLGAVLMIVVSTELAVLWPSGTQELTETWGIGAGAGAIFAVLATMIWYGCAEQAPGRKALTVHDPLSRLRSGFTTGLALTSVPAVLIEPPRIRWRLQPLRGWSRARSQEVPQRAS